MGVRCGALSIASPDDQAIYSKYLQARLDVPASASDGMLLEKLDEMRDLLGGDLPVLVPTSDRFAKLLADNRARLSGQYRLRCSAPVLYDAFLDKWKTAQICLENGVPIPDTLCPQSAADLAACSGRLQFPVIIKPRYTFDDRFPGKNAIVESEEELARFFSDNAVLGESVIQQIIPSGDGDIIVVALFSGADARVRSIYSGRKLRQWRPDYGATCFGISERHPELEELSKNFVERIGYQGLAALEFARSRDDGKLYFIELNTRSYYHNQLFADAGVDITACAYNEMTGRESPVLARQPVQKEGLVWLDFRRDYASMMEKRKHGQITLLEWALSLPKARSFAYWSLDDPWPFIRACEWRFRRVTGNLIKYLK
jgi:predicted ATP-grasp superfamily ATP-dependent carboligase